MPLYTSTGALNVALSDTTGTGRYSASGALRINLVSGTSYVGLYAADGSMNVVDVTGVSISTYGGLYHPSGAIRGRTAPTTLSGLQAPDGSYYFLGLFSPLNLFSAGEQGAWYDPSDLSTMFQDSAGVTPVTAVEQPVGLILDKSKGLALGSELITNGDFSGGTTGWTASGAATLSLDAGRLKITSSSSYAYASQALTLVIGRTYKLTYSITNGDATACYMYVDPAAGLNADTYNSGAKADGTYSAVFVANATTIYVKPFIAGAGKFAFYDNISVREVTGNHASQSTSASRPVLSARVNLLTKTEQFDDAAWAKTGITVTANQTTAPDGTNTADMAAVNNGSQSVALYQDLTALTASTNHTVSACVKKNGAQYAVVGWFYSAGTYGAVAYDLDTQLVSRSSAGGGFTIVSSSITPLGSEWYRISVTATVPSTAAFSRFPCVFPRVTAWTSGPPDGTDTGNGTSGIYIWGADLRVTNDGVGIPAYQRVGAAVTATTNPAVTGVPDYDTSGFPLYLRFDGTDDSLSTASVDFSATDKMSVFAGVRKLSDAATGFLVELGDGWATQNNSFGIYAPSYRTGSLPANKYFLGLKGSTGTREEEYATYTAPLTNVLNVNFNIGAAAASQVSTRINGAVVSAASAGGDAGGGNFGNHIMRIGRYAGSFIPLNGRLYSLIVRGAQSTDAQIASTEAWVNNVTKGY